ncbi:MAG TPA: hypothetical protein VFK02_23965 [Kofleriaceae bacterium]|nr:hypothetical protein [Kofleriaceae bacterium]
MPDLDTFRDTVKVRLDAMRDTTGRSRMALLATSLAALSLLIADFNMYLSWNRTFALMPRFAGEQSPTDEAQHRLLGDWVDSLSMSISPLGIHVSVADATLLGGIGLYFLTLWFFYCMRRENHLIGDLLRDTRNADRSIMDLTYSGIMSYMVFTAVHPDRQPVASLAQVSTSSGRLGRAAHVRWRTTRYPGTQLLFWLPPLAIVFSIVLDVISIYWLAAPFRTGRSMPVLGVAEAIRFWTYVMIGLVCLAATGYNAHRVNALDRATGAVLREYGELLEAPARDAAAPLAIGEPGPGAGPGGHEAQARSLASHSLAEVGQPPSTQPEALTSG